jgi:UDP-N-acetylglucosamine 2-epimerase (non-hydrolysing)/GDP/UDP-N,N'-diacetylbacillosamine 2-epimerase (hydrolysing)
MKVIQADDKFKLQIIATGAHMSPEFGLTYKVIEEDGFAINEKVEMLLSSDTAVGISKSLGLATIGFADAFDRLKPDMVVLLGDRYEILASAQAALIARIPTSHLIGGDTTEGAFDEAIRHSISKMAQLHFVTNELSARRVQQLGENPMHIYNVGSPGIDYIKRVQLCSRNELEQDIAFEFKEKNLLVTFHPVTLDNVSSVEQLAELLKALDSLGNNIGIVFTKANADTEGRIINRMIDDYVEIHPASKAFTSLGQVRYLSTISQVDVVVGNSSSGLYEVPSFNKPTVNIGDRQKGRLQALSVVSCKPEALAIKEAINEALNKDCSTVQNPYGDGDSSIRILSILKSIPDYTVLLKKQFFMMEL